MKTSPHLPRVRDVEMQLTAKGVNVQYRDRRTTDYRLKLSPYGFEIGEQWKLSSEDRAEIVRKHLNGFQDVDVIVKHNVVQVIVKDII